MDSTCGFDVDRRAPGTCLQRCTEKGVCGAFLAEQEVLDVVENILQERISDNMPEQTVDMPVSQVELARYSEEAGSSWPGANDTTSAASAASTAVAKSVGSDDVGSS